MYRLLLIAALVAGVTSAGDAAARWDRAGAQAAAPAVLAGAGDIAGCAWTSDEQTAALLDQIPGTVFTVGDNVYFDGTLANYLACYDPSWGRHKARTRPAVGNHDYFVDENGYHDYFGEAAGPRGLGYYSYDAGAWHVVVLNGECYLGAVGCGPDSPQAQWLRADLSTHPTRCTAAIFHYPLFNSGGKGNNPSGLDLWRILYQYGVEIVMSGDDHVYERFAPQTPDGALDLKRGIRQFTIGTGGALPGDIVNVKPNSEARFQDVFGVLKLTLYPKRYAWQFVPVAGQTASDTGSERCHAARST